MIPIFEPYFSGNETKYINQCLKTKWISSQGSFVKKFEKKLIFFRNCKKHVLGAPDFFSKGDHPYLAIGKN